MNAQLPAAKQLRIAGGILLAFLFLPVASYFLFPGGYNAHRILCSRLLCWLEVVLLFAYAKWVEGGSFFKWSSERRKPGFYFASVGALYLLALGSGIVSNIPRLFGVPANRQLVTAFAVLLYHNIPLLVLTVITAGVTEELVFRAYLVPRLELFFKNKYMPVIISALMFSALHFRYHSIQELLFAFCIGIVFAIYYQWYRNIIALIVTHTIIDFIAVLLTGFAEVYKQAHHML